MVEIFAGTNFRTYSRRDKNCAKICTIISRKSKDFLFFIFWTLSFVVFSILAMTLIIHFSILRENKYPP